MRPRADGCTEEIVSCQSRDRSSADVHLRKATLSAVMELTLLLHWPGGGAQLATLSRGEASRSVILCEEEIALDEAAKELAERSAPSLVRLTESCSES